MPKYFECLTCNKTSEIVTTPPICPACGQGTGMITAMPKRRPSGKPKLPDFELLSAPLSGEQK